ncbi:MAG: hypothetical protein KA316_16200 [Rhodoferax sp.]|nr:hypothetical protein [Rhodoferax sp.]
MNRQRGAALLVMLLIAGVLGSFFALQVFGGGRAERAKISSTTTSLTQARDALAGFAHANGRLPRPATSALNGAESAGPCITEVACTGLIPWATLGIGKLDAWGKIIRYSVSPAFADSPIAPASIPSKKLQTRDLAGVLSFLAGSAAACTAVSGCIPAIVFSHGMANFGTTDAGVAIPNQSLTNIDEISNNTGAGIGVTYVQRTVSQNNSAALGGEFDDIVIALPRNLLP